MTGATIKLTTAEVLPYALPFASEYATARGSLDRRDLVLLRLTDEDGVHGLGEGVPLTLRRSGDLRQTVLDLESWAATSCGPTAIDWRTGTAPERHGGPPDPGSLCPPARIAIRTALADLEARRRDVPLWRLLGAADAQPVPCNATLVAADPEPLAADAIRWAERGFGTFKLKVGLEPEPLASGAPDRDLLQIAAVRDALGPDAAIRLDANGAWSYRRALQAIDSATPYDIELVEQPVADLEQMARLRTDLGGVVAIACDESVDSPEAARLAVELGACDMATVKLSKTGSLDPTLDSALPVYLSSALDGPVGIAAAAHAYQVLRQADPSASNRAHGLATACLFAESIASNEAVVRDGFLHPPAGPGLGVELEASALLRHATRSSPC